KGQRNQRGIIRVQSNALPIRPHTIMYHTQYLKIIALKLMKNIFVFFSALLWSVPVLAEGLAQPWQLGFQEPVTPVMERLFSLHQDLLILITVICVFVLGLLLYICIRFNAKANPVPSKTSHNTL